MKALLFVACISAIASALCFALARFGQTREKQSDCQMGYDGDLFI
jgi:hypothetical protein